MRIVVGVDGSAESLRAVDWCARYAPGLEAEVIAVHAISFPVYPSEVGFAPVPLYTPEDREKLRHVLEETWCAALARAGVAYHTVVTDGAPGLVIEDIASAEHSDLVVVGRRGLGGFAEHLLGSTSHMLTHHVHRPIVLVP
jgi:nucleotide-binding universal stress UspA family protein